MKKGQVSFKLPTLYWELNGRKLIQTFQTKIYSILPPLQNKISNLQIYHDSHRIWKTRVCLNTRLKTIPKLITSRVNFIILSLRCSSEQVKLQQQIMNESKSNNRRDSNDP